ncbi:MAG: SBBP repeat-containing protein, partial [Flavobacteriales bacterium]|nr:SBBP repeat-containing protein [Flavobacteriales bacterium]
MTFTTQFRDVVLAAALLLLGGRAQAQLCALDVFVANDQSGSVSAIENTQSRQFITALFNGMQPWGNGAGESRMAIADWDSPGVWQQFAFPVAGVGYTTLLSDVLAYQTAPRALLGGTDPFTALNTAYQSLGQTPIPGRVAHPVIVLMTDAACSQVPPGLSALAAQIKNAGVYIVVVAIEAASSCPSLAGTNVASPGGYFSAPTYSQLVQANVQLVQDMINAGCSFSFDPSYDLAISLDAFTASGCISGTPSFAVDYTVNNGTGADFTGPLTISFYNGDPALPTTTLLAVQTVGAMTIAMGGSYSGSFSSVSLAGTTVLYAIVNFNGTAPGNGTPVVSMSSSDMVVADEWMTFNNKSNQADRVNDPITCPPQALLYTDIVSGGTGCDDIVPYEITICNNGDAAAYITPTLPIAVPGAVLVTNLNQTGSYTNELDWATYYGGILLEEGRAVATDPSGNVYLAGTTRSTSLISTPGSHLAAAPANRNAFLAKFTSAGVRLWATYYGGSGADYGMGVTTDAAGNVYLVGITESTAGIATAGTYQTAFSASTDGFIAKFNSAGVRQWGSYFGGSDMEEGYSVAVDNLGGVYLAGITEGSTTLASAGAFQTAFGGISDQFLVKFNANTGALLWSTYYGGTDDDIEANVACDPFGNAYLVGQTSSAAGIASAGAFQTVLNINPDVYLAKFSSAGVRQWATYFGGAETEEMPSVACDASGDIFISGTTDSDDGIAYNSIHQSFRAGSKDGFLARFDGTGNVIWGTYVGGSDTEDLTDVAVDPTGKVVVAGFTQSPDGISTVGSYKENIDAVSDDAFVMKFYGDGTFSWGTYYGGDDNEEQYSVAVDPAGDVYIAGFTPSLIEVATTGAHQTVNNGNDDAYLAKFGEHELPRILYPGECFVRQYVYDYSAVAAGTYDLSLGLTATPFSVVDPNPLVLPDQNFNAGTFVNISGFNGAVHSSDNAVIPVSGTICPPGDLISIAVNIPAVSSCGNGNYAQATVTITNLSGLAVSNTDLYLDLTGAGATFVGEPYNMSAGLNLAAPDLLDPFYPFVLYAVNGQSGVQTLPILAIPPGTSTFQVDLNIGSTLTNLFARIDSIHTGINASGQSNLASDVAGVTALVVPVIDNFTCPGAINAGSNIVFNGIT